MSYGRQDLGKTGNDVMLSADGFPEWKPGGITIDWSTVVAVSGSPVTLTDGTVVAVGEKALDVGAVLCKITTSGMFGPYKSDAADGRQNLKRGDAYILNRSVHMTAPFGLGRGDADHPPVIEGGVVWKARLKVGGAGQPALADFETAFPGIRYAQN